MINNPQSRQRVWWIGGGVVFAVTLAVVLLVRFSSKEPFGLSDSRFVVTTLPGSVLPANATSKDRMVHWWTQMYHKIKPPPPLNYGFPASTNMCSIHGWLNACMGMTGVRYVIAKEVAGGTVKMGHSNYMGGAEWTVAFTEALKNGQAQWWDYHRGEFRNEKLVLLTNDAKTVLVMPRELADEFRGKRAK